MSCHSAVWKWSRLILLLITVGFLALTSCGGAAAKSRTRVSLVRDGKPACSIVIAKDATRSAQFAGYELQYHIWKITGAKVPIGDDETNIAGARILVGDSKLTAALGLDGKTFGEQEYIIRLSGDTIILMGKDKEDRGKVDYNNFESMPWFFDAHATCYAVYDFLEKFCGVRWYLPTDLGIAFVPRKTLAVSGSDVRRAPAMKYRWAELLPLHADLCGDTVDNGIVPTILSSRDERLWDHRSRLGGTAYDCNHSLEGYYDRFLKSHPDWFAQGYQGNRPNLCYTNPELIAQVVQDARDYFDGKGLKLGARGGGDYFAVVPMDGAGWCKCPRCEEALKDGDSNYLWSFVNAVAKEVGKSHPGKFIAALAYSNYVDPPTKVKLEPNISVQLCLTLRAVADDFTVERNKRVLAQWSAESKKRQKFLWEYFCFPAICARGLNTRCFPPFFAHYIPTQMAAMHKAGIKGVFIEPSYLVHGTRSILLDQVEWYVTMKLADDPTLDGNKLIDEFFDRYYGAAAGPMHEFYNRIEEAYADKKNYGDLKPGFCSLQSEEAAWKYLGNEARMAEFDKLMEQAKSAARTETEKQRVALFENGIWQYMQAGRKDYLNDEALKPVTMQQVRVNRIGACEGDPARVDWSAASPMFAWRTIAGQTSPRKIDARIAHDDNYLYLRLEEQIDTRTLILVGNTVWESDDWELFFALTRSKPYYQLGVDSNGFHIALVDGDSGPVIKYWDSGAVVKSDVSSGNRWTVLLALPLSKLIDGGARPGSTLYMNIVRGAGHSRVFESAAWVPTFGAYGETSRFGEMTLEK